MAKQLKRTKKREGRPRSGPTPANPTLFAVSSGKKHAGGSRLERKLSPLLVAAENGDVAALRRLVQSDADVLQRADPRKAFYHGADAVILAARNGHLPAVKVLLQHGASLDTQGGYGSALEEAVANGHVEVVQLLLRHGARNLGYGPFSAVEGRHTKVLKAIACEGISLAEFRSRSGDSLLEYAIRRKRDELVRCLLDLGVKPSDGGPLVESAARGDETMTKLLLKHGADPNQVNRMRRYPLSTACSHGYKEVASILLDNGAELSLVDFRGWSCVDWAAHGGHKALIPWLVSIARKRGQCIPRNDQA